jgi:hypothetical protein
VAAVEEVEVEIAEAVEEAVEVVAEEALSMKALRLKYVVSVFRCFFLMN